MRRRRSPEVIAGRVNADGSISSASGDFTVLKGATGVYTLTFPASFRLVGFSGSHSGGSAATVNAGTPVGGNSVVINYVIASTSSLSDGAFYFVAVGVQQ